MNKQAKSNAMLIVILLILAGLGYYFFLYEGGIHNPFNSVVVNPNAEYPSGTNIKTCTIEKALTQAEVNMATPERVTQWQQNCVSLGKSLVFYEVVNTATLSNLYSKYPTFCSPDCK